MKITNEDIEVLGEISFSTDYLIVHARAVGEGGYDIPLESAVHFAFLTIKVRDMLERWSNSMLSGVRFSDVEGGQDALDRVPEQE